MLRPTVSPEGLRKIFEIYPLPESEPRQGFFAEETFTKLYKELPDHLKPVAEFGLYTGRRRGEITAMEWDWVHRQEHKVYLPAEATKNGETDVIELQGELWRIVETQWQKRLPGCPYVFHHNGRRIRTFYKAGNSACKRAGCSDALFHNFRRTAARNFRKGGLTEREAMLLTGHRDRSVFERYNIVDESDRKDATWRAQAFVAEKLREAWQKCGTEVKVEKEVPCQPEEKKVG